MDTSPSDGTAPRRPLGQPNRLALALAIGLTCLCGLVGCGPSLPFVWVKQLPQEKATAERTALAPGDQLLVVIKDQKELSGEFLVRDDGSYLQPLLGMVRVEGKTSQQVAEDLVQQFKRLIINPQITVSLVGRRPLNLSVMGEVRAPGAFEVSHSSTVLGVIARAGGLTEFADPDQIYVVRKEPELSRIRFTMDLLAEPNGISTRFRLHDGDVIVVE